MEFFLSKFDFFKRWIVISFAVFVVAISFWWISNQKFEVVINNRVFNVEVADTKAGRERGLSGHKPLLENGGMFFIFPKSDKHGFWMKDMTFPIDIIWIDENFKVVHIEKSVSPETYPKVFYPDSPAMYVLEVSDGQASALGLRVGDHVVFLKK